MLLEPNKLVNAKNIFLLFLLNCATSINIGMYKNVNQKVQFYTKKIEMPKMLKIVIMTVSLIYVLNLPVVLL